MTIDVPALSIEFSKTLIECSMELFKIMNVNTNKDANDYANTILNCISTLVTFHILSLSAMASSDPKKILETRQKIVITFNERLLDQLKDNEEEMLEAGAEHRFKPLIILNKEE